MNHQREKWKYRRRQRVFWPWYLLTHPKHLLLLIAIYTVLYFLAPIIEPPLKAFNCWTRPHKYYCRANYVPAAQP